MRRIASLLGLALLAGCAGKPVAPNYELHFGKAVREARQRMTINTGPASTDPVAGIDGQAARDTQERYHESFRKPPPVVNVINIGGAIGSGGGGGGGR